MGSPLSPILASIVMDHLLDNCIPKLPFDLPFLYKYVDDIVCSVPGCHVDTMLSVFNWFDSHLQFTVERETEISVPFLDTRVIRCGDQKVLLDWYTKPTYTGRYINYHSNHTINQKINTVRAMCSRVRQISLPSFLNKNLRRFSSWMLLFED